MIAPTYTNPFSQPFTVEAVETIFATDPRDLIPFESSRVRHLQILNDIYGTSFTDTPGHGTMAATQRSGGD